MRAKGQSRSLAELASRQHGVVSIRQLTGPLGYSRRSVAVATEAGRLHRLHRGVYAVGHTASPSKDIALLLSWPADPTRCSATIRRPGFGAFPPGLPIRCCDRTQLTKAAAADPAARRSEPCARGSSPARGDPGDLSRPYLLRRRGNVTSQAPTADARAQRRAEAIRPETVESVLERNQGHGAGPLRRALALYKPSPFNRSGVERRFLELVPRPAFRNRPPATTRRASSSTSTGPSTASQSNSTPSRPTAPARPSSATASVTRS